MRSFDDAVSAIAVQPFDALVFLVDLNFGDVTAIHQQITKSADRPDFCTTRSENLMGFEPITHEEIRGTFDVSLENLNDELSPIRIGTQNMICAAHKAERHLPAIPHSFFSAHPHFNANFLAGLLALIGFGAHQHHFHETARCSVAVGGIVQGDEINIMGAKLFIQDVELATTSEAVIPGAKHAIDLPAFHQKTHAC